MEIKLPNCDNGLRSEIKNGLKINEMIRSNSEGEKLKAKVEP